MLHTNSFSWTPLLTEDLVSEAAYNIVAAVATMAQQNTVFTAVLYPATTRLPSQPGVRHTRPRRLRLGDVEKDKVKLAS